MGIRPPSIKKADKGTIVHKALETMARVKKARQEGKNSYEDEAFGHVSIDEATPEWATRRAYEYYTRIASHTEWSDYDLTDCLQWTDRAIQLNKGMFDPRNRHIVEPELRFDFEINKPWAYYKYDLNGDIIEGQLALKGTIDLIVEDTPGLIEIIDWKTGQRKDWAKDGNEKKTYKELRYDPQLCLYHYAASRLFPNADEIFLTIVFINDGGPYTLCFDKSDVEFTERIIETKFKQIRDTQIPQLRKTWKCTKFCYFGMNRSTEDPTKTICEFFKEKISNNGIDNTMKEYGKEGAYNEYGEGGGRKE